MFMGHGARFPKILYIFEGHSSPAPCSHTYKNMIMCPADKINRSQFIHARPSGSNRRSFPNKAVSISAHPISIPRCRQFAASTASTNNPLAPLMADDRS
jgi:hypothetical protein